jgi:hypothetical protein
MAEMAMILINEEAVRSVVAHIHGLSSASQASTESQLAGRTH